HRRRRMAGAQGAARRAAAGGDDRVMVRRVRERRGGHVPAGAWPGVLPGLGALMALMGLGGSAGLGRLLAGPVHPRAAAAPAPTLAQIVGLRRAASPAISPDGRQVAYTVRDTDWVANAFVTQVWLADVATGDLRQLTRGPKSNNAPAWSPDGRTLAFGSE